MPLILSGPQNLVFSTVKMTNMILFVVTCLRVKYDTLLTFNVFSPHPTPSVGIWIHTHCFYLVWKPDYFRATL